MVSPRWWPWPVLPFTASPVLAAIALPGLPRRGDTGRTEGTLLQLAGPREVGGGHSCPGLVGGAQAGAAGREGLGCPRFPEPVSASVQWGQAAPVLGLVGAVRQSGQTWLEGRGAVWVASQRGAPPTPRLGLSPRFAASSLSAGTAGALPRLCHLGVAGVSADQCHLTQGLAVGCGRSSAAFPIESFRTAWPSNTSSLPAQLKRPSVPGGPFSSEPSSPELATPD